VVELRIGCGKLICPEVGQNAHHAAMVSMPGILMAGSDLVEMYVEVTIFRTEKKAAVDVHEVER
jgi:hypothetical protein